MSDDSPIELKLKDLESESGHISPRLKSRVIGKMWYWIFRNHHKLSEGNKLKAALAIITKDMPTQLDGKVSETIINIIKAQTPEDKPKESIIENGRRLSINA